MGRAASRRPPWKKANPKKTAGTSRKLTPAQARQEGIALRTLDTEAVATLEALGEALLPGSAAAGLAQYLDHQLSGDPADSMLMKAGVGLG